MNYYVVIRVDDKIIDKILYAIRILVKNQIGDVITPAHITVKGPYKIAMAKEDLRIENKKIKLTPIKIKGIDTFEINENLIIHFKCNAPQLLSVWDKPSFPISKFGYNPHITLYNNIKGDFSNKLLATLQEYKNIKFTINNIKLVNLSKTYNYKVLHKKAMKLIKMIAYKYKIENIKTENNRLFLINSLFSLLRIYLKSNPI